MHVGRMAVICGLCAGVTVASAQLGKSNRNDYISVDAPVVALEHVRLIDGTGGPERADQTIVIEHGKIVGVGAADVVQVPAGAQVMDLRGHTVYPGLVGMHEHLFYPEPGDGQPAHLPLYGEMADSAPRLYLAAGVTTARTTGSIEPYTDLAVKQLVDSGKIPGPDFYITSPYLEGAPPIGPQLHVLTGPADAARTVDYWAAEGVTSYKAYMHITPAELAAAIQHVHAHGLKITGHLCSIGFRQAAEMGIDNLEHGLIVDTEFVKDKQPGVCPGQDVGHEALAKLEVSGPEIQKTIHVLVEQHVAVTSTLAIFESFVPNEPPMREEMRARKVLFPAAWNDYVTRRAAIAEHAQDSLMPRLFKMEMEFERDFVKQGGLLMFGCDPTGYGGVLPGYGDQRALELLVKAGFTPEQAIQIATENGAKFLGILNRVGTVAEGKQADLVVVTGDPGKDIHDVENVDVVFKDGVGYDPAKVIAPIVGWMGIR